ncbi:hypothetical protein BH23VER1_BH23VER1_01940 [soil metagenome]
MAAIAVLWAAVYLPGLGSTELKGEEARRILPGRNMIMTGDWVVPAVGGRPYSRKPPLINWLVAGSFLATGVQNEWTARIPSVLAVLALGIGIVGFGARWMGVPAAAAAAVFALTNLALMEKGRLAEIEPLYVALSGLAFAAWSACWMLGRSPWLTYSLPWLFLGLAMLAKGPVHLLFFYAPVTATLGFSRRLRELASLPHLAGIALMLAVSLPWASLNKNRLAGALPESEQPDAIWLNQFTSRLDFAGFDLADWIATPFESALNFAPWVFLLGVLWWRAARRDWAGDGGRMVWIWMRGTAWGSALSFLAVALVPGALARYTHPAIVPAALLTAVLLARTVPPESHVFAVWRTANRWLLYPVAALGILVLFVPGSLAEIDRLAAVAAVAIALAGLFRLRWHLFASGALMAAIVFLYCAAAIPQMRAREDIRPVGRAFADMLPPGARLCVINPGIQPFLFYLDVPYAVVDRASRIPDGTTHALLSREVLGKVRGVARFEQFGFERVGEIREKRGDDYLMLKATR